MNTAIQTLEIKDLATVEGGYCYKKPVKKKPVVVTCKRRRRCGHCS